MHQQMLYFVATLLIVYELSLTTIPSLCAMAAVVGATSASSSLKGTEMDVNGFTHINKPTMMTEQLNRLPRQAVQRLLKKHQQQLDEHQEYQQQIEDSSSLVNSKIKRSFPTGGGWASKTFNGLEKQHTSSRIAQQQMHQQYTEAKPIYEEQQENDYTGASGGGGLLYGQHSSGIVADTPALHSAIYNLQTAGTHNTAVGTSGSDSRASNGGSDGFLPSWNFRKLSASFAGSQTASTPYGSSSGSHTATTSNGNGKISEGNFPHHYDSTSAFNEYPPLHEYEPYQQQFQQQQQLQKPENVYNSVEHGEATSTSYEDDQENDSNNYPPSASADHFPNYGQHEFEQQQQEQQPDVINYVPYPVVKKQHVPVREPVQIPVSHAVIIPVGKPVPIHIPVQQNVQVPVEQELKIPVERVVPYPVEKHVPVPVEKRVPYPVVKYVPVKISRPFPVKVPVFKTVLHRVKGWW